MALKIMDRVAVLAKINGGVTEDAEIVIAYGNRRAILSIEAEDGSDATLYIDDFTSLSELAEHLTLAARGEGDEWKSTPTAREGVDQ